MERPEQSRRVVNDVIKEATEGNMGRFYDHFLRGFVVPENDDGTVGDRGTTISFHRAFM